MQGLTKKQAELLRIIRKHIEEHGASPSLRELRDAVGNKAHGVVHKRLCALRDRGLITWEPHRARSIKLLDPSPVRDYLQSRLETLRAAGAPHDRIAAVVAELADLPAQPS